MTPEKRQEFEGIINGMVSETPWLCCMHPWGVLPCFVGRAPVWLHDGRGSRYRRSISREFEFSTDASSGRRAGAIPRKEAVRLGWAGVIGSFSGFRNFRVSRAIRFEGSWRRFNGMYRSGRRVLPGRFFFFLSPLYFLFCFPVCRILSPLLRSSLIGCARLRECTGGRGAAHPLFGTRGLRDTEGLARGLHAR